MIHTVKGFHVINEAEVDVFFWNSLAFSMIQRMLAIWSLVPLLFVYSLYIWKFTVDVLLKPSLKNIEHYLVSMWNDLSCTIVWTFLVIAFLWDYSENRSLSEFPTVCCDPYSQRLWHSQQSRNRCFPGIFHCFQIFCNQHKGFKQFKKYILLKI